MGIRFGMTGSLDVDGTPGVEEMYYAPNRRNPAWDRWKVRFEDGGSLVVQDPRRLGGVLLDPDLSGLGPDAVDITLSELTAILSGSAGSAQGPAARPVQGGGDRQPHRRRAAVAGGPLTLRPSESLTPNEVRRLHRNLGRTLADLTGGAGPTPAS